MGKWDFEANKADGYPEGYKEWYVSVYKPQVGDDAVGMDNAVHIFNTQKEQEKRLAFEKEQEEPKAKHRQQQWEKGILPEGTLINSYDAGANRYAVDKGRDYQDVTKKLNTEMANSEKEYSHMPSKSEPYKTATFLDLVRN